MRRRVLTVCGSLRPQSANRAAIDIAATYLRSRGDVDIDDSNLLARIPPLNDSPDHDPGPAVLEWRKRIAGSDAVLIAAPEYAGGVAGTIKNALDWIVGSGGVLGWQLRSIGDLVRDAACELRPYLHPGQSVLPEAPFIRGCGGNLRAGSQ